MHALRQEIAVFLEGRDIFSAEARQAAALQIACHIDLGEALSADRPTRERIILRLSRTLERERLRGARRHWSYDLNRHIALKQVLERLRALHLDFGERPKATRIQRTRRPRTQTAPEGAVRLKS